MRWQHCVSFSYAVVWERTSKKFGFKAAHRTSWTSWTLVIVNEYVITNAIQEPNHNHRSIENHHTKDIKRKFRSAETSNSSLFPWSVRHDYTPQWQNITNLKDFCHLHGCRVVQETRLLSSGSFAPVSQKCSVWFRATKTFLHKH